MPSPFAYQSFYKAIPSGPPGTVVTTLPQVIQSRFMDTTNTPQYTGQAVSIVNGKLQYMTTAVATDFYGVLARVAPRIGGTIASDFGTTIPNIAFEQSVWQKGVINVTLDTTDGLPTINGQVYLKVVLVGPNWVQTYTTVAGANTFAIPNCRFAAADVDAFDTTIIEIY